MNAVKTNEPLYLYVCPRCKQFKMERFSVRNKRIKQKTNSSLNWCMLFVLLLIIILGDSLKNYAYSQSSSDSLFVIVVGNYSDSAQANQVIAYLKSKNYDPFYAGLSDNNMLPIGLDLLNNRKNAEEKLNQYRLELKPDLWIEVIPSTPFFETFRILREQKAAQSNQKTTASIKTSNRPKFNIKQIDYSKTDITNRTQMIGYARMKLDSIYNSVLKSSPIINLENNQAILNQLFSPQFDTTPLFKIQNKWLDERAKALQTDLGLKFSASLSRNLSDANSEDGDYYYRDRAYFELGMDLLQNGLFANQNKARQTEIEQEINRIEGKSLLKKSNYPYLYTYLIYIFNQWKINYLDSHIHYLEQQIDLCNLLYHLRYKSWEELLGLKSEKAEKEILLSNYKRYNENLKRNYPEIKFPDSTISDRLPYLDIILDKIITPKAGATPNDTILLLKQEKLQLQESATHQISLKPYLRYNVYNSYANNDRRFSSIGLNFSIPIRPSNRKQIIASGNEYLTSEHKINTNSFDNEILNYYYEYQYTLKQLYHFYFKLSLLEERVRKENIKKAMANDDFSPMQTLYLLDEIKGVQAEIIDLKQILYLKLLKIFQYTESENITDITTNMNPFQVLSRFPGERSVYLWSDYFKKTPNEILMNQLQINEFRKVMFSPGTQFNEEKLTDFLDICSKNKIEVYAMVGNNEWAKDAENPKIYQKIESLQKYAFAGIHLDIEPHVLPDWENKRDQYLSNLIDIYAGVKKQCELKNQKLAVSIPLSYPPEALEGIYTFADYVYLMAYEHPDIEYLARKSEEERHFDLGKTVFALRVEDFKNRYALEDFLEKLQIQLLINNVAIHDLERLSEMDNELIYDHK